jgi:hypothetical protein
MAAAVNRSYFLPRVILIDDYSFASRSAWGDDLHPTSRTRVIEKESVNQENDGWAATGFVDTLLRWSMKPEVWDGNEKAVQPRVQG